MPASSELGAAAPGQVGVPARLLTTLKDASKLSAGDVLVTHMTAPDWVPFMRKAAAVVTDSGGMTCHAAIVSWPSATAALVDQAQRSLDEIDGVKGIAVAGGPREELTKLAEDVDLLIAGSRGYGPRGCVLHGSVSSYLERHVSSALLIVPRGPAQTAAGDPADGHELAEVAVPAGAPLR